MKTTARLVLFVFLIWGAIYYGGLFFPQIQTSFVCRFIAGYTFEIIFIVLPIVVIIGIVLEEVL